MLRGRLYPRCRNERRQHTTSPASHPRNERTAEDIVCSGGSGGVGGGEKGGRAEHHRQVTQFKPVVPAIQPNRACPPHHMHGSSPQTTTTTRENEADKRKNRLYPEPHFPLSDQRPHPYPYPHQPLAHYASLHHKDCMHAATTEISKEKGVHYTLIIMTLRLDMETRRRRLFIALKPSRKPAGSKLTRQDATGKTQIIKHEMKQPKGYITRRRQT
jgi:hypothetical protein